MDDAKKILNSPHSKKQPYLISKNPNKNQKKCSTSSFKAKTTIKKSLFLLPHFSKKITRRKKFI